LKRNWLADKAVATSSFGSSVSDSGSGLSVGSGPSGASSKWSFAEDDSVPVRGFDFDLSVPSLLDVVVIGVVNIPRFGAVLVRRSSRYAKQ